MKFTLLVVIYILICVSLVESCQPSTPSVTLSEQILDKYHENLTASQHEVYNHAKETLILTYIRLFVQMVGVSILFTILCMLFQNLF